MTAEFFVEEGPLTGLILTLDGGEQWMIGRDPDQCQLLLEDADVERQHLLCRKTESGYTLKDISEGQKTLINEEVFAGETALNDGDSILIGATVLRFLSKEIESFVVDNQLVSENKAEDDTIFEQTLADYEKEEGAQPELSDLSDSEPEEEGAFDEPIQEELIEEPMDQQPESSDADEDFEEASNLDDKVDASEESAMEETVEQEVIAEDDKVDASEESAMEETVEEEVIAEDDKVDASEESAMDETVEEEVIAEDDKVDASEESAMEETVEQEAVEENAPFEQIEEFHIDLTQSARFILKVIAGPNTGAEFAIDIGKEYRIGTDTTACDIVFHDLSVSGEHALLQVGDDGKATIKDLNSRNGVLIDQKKIQEQAELDSNGIVTIGTTSFFLIDKEAPQETIVTPVFEPPEPEVVEEVVEEQVAHEELEPEYKEKKPSLISGALILSVFVIGFIALLGVGIFSLHDPKVVELPGRNYTVEIHEALEDFSGVKFNYNTVSHKLFLVGHVLNGVKMNEMHYKLQGLSFLKGVDDNVVDDEAVWQEMNLLLAKHSEFKGVSMHSSDPGIFVLNGYLKTNKQGASLTDYMNLHFNYLSNLQNRVVIEEQVDEEVSSMLVQKGFRGVESQFLNGELSLTGYIGSTQTYDFDHLMRSLAELPGVRTILNHVVVVSPEQQVVDLTLRFPGRFKVTGYSKHGDVNVNVVINGRILSRGDTLEGLTITSIQPHTVFLEKEGLKYKIDYNK